MQLTFACKAVSIDDLLKCSLALSRTEMQILKTIPQGKESDVNAVSSIVKKDRTVVQRALSGLHVKGLVRRRQINLSNGGYYFIYIPVPKAIIKEKIYENFKRFNKAVEDAINRW
jgi:predicted transcriptional regulator